MTLPPAALTVSAQATPDGTRLELEGDVDLTTATQFTETLTSAVTDMLAAPDRRRLSVDMRRVHFIDSAGLAALVSARKRLAPAAGTVHLLLTPQTQPDRVLSLGRFDTIMALTYPPEEQQESQPDRV